MECPNRVERYVLGLGVDIESAHFVTDMGELRACQKLWSGRGYAKAQRLDRRQAYWSLNSAISHLGPDMLVPGSGWPRIAGEQAEQQQVGSLSWEGTI